MNQLTKREKRSKVGSSKKGFFHYARDEEATNEQIYKQSTKNSRFDQKVELFRQVKIPGAANLSSI